MRKRSRTSTYKTDSRPLATSLALFAVLCGLLIFSGTGWNSTGTESEDISPCSEFQRSNQAAKAYIERALDALDKNNFGEAQNHLQRAADALTAPLPGERLADKEPKGR